MIVLLVKHEKKTFLLNKCIYTKIITQNQLILYGNVLESLSKTLQEHITYR